MPGTALEPVRVLLVDDDAGLVDVAAASLEHRSDLLTAVTETSAADGLDRIADEEIDCVVSDYGMPEMDGLAFLERVREEHPELPFILFTGKGSEDVASDAISRGVTDYLQKRTDPSQYTVLANRIENAVEQHRFRQRVEGQYQAMGAAMDGMAILDGEETYEYVNEAHAEMYGYDDPAELVGRTWECLYDDDELERIDREIMSEFREAGQWRGEAVGLRKDGTTFPQELSLSALDDGRIVCVVRDVTSRKRREDALEETNRQLEAILDTTTAAVFLKDLDGRYMLMNQKCRKVLGVGDAEIEGTTDYDLFPEDVADKYTADDRRVLEAEETIEIEEEVPTADGTRIYRTLKSPVFDEDGEPYGVCAVTTDVTERREYERQLQRQNEQWETFASVVSHDLKNPLSVAKGELELVREECGDGCAPEHLPAVADALDRMVTIVDDTLTLARQGRTVAEMQRITLAGLAVDEWERIATDGAELSVESDVRIDADPERLRHVFHNLFQNAVEHAARRASGRSAPEDAVEHGDADVTVRLGALDDGGGFYVADDGPGVPTDDPMAVFEPDVSTTEEGTGLGLVIVERIVEAHGWEITATESDADGARFEITGVTVA